MKRLLSALFGILVLGIVVFFGVQSQTSNFFTLPFGLACAIGAPLGLSALGYSFKKADPTLERLSKISKIEDLIIEAETQEEKIERLQRERDELLRIIRHEADYYTMIQRKEVLEEDIYRILEQLNELNSKIKKHMSTPNAGITPSEMSQELQALYIQLKGKREQENRVKIGTYEFIIEGIMDIMTLPSQLIAESMNRFLESVIVILDNYIRALIKSLMNLSNNDKD